MNRWIIVVSGLSLTGCLGSSGSSGEDVDAATSDTSPPDVTVLDSSAPSDVSGQPTDIVWHTDSTGAQDTHQGGDTGGPPLPGSCLGASLDDPLCWGWHEIGPVSADDQLTGLCLDAAGVLWGLSGGGELSRWADGAFEVELVEPTRTAWFTDLHCGADGLWATSWEGDVWHRRGPSDWEVTRIRDGVRLRAVAGSADTGTWVVGDAGTLARWTDAGWQTTEVPGAPTLTGVWAGDGTVYITAERGEGAGLPWLGAVYRWHADALEVVYTDSAGGLRCVAATGAGDVWVGGDGEGGPRNLVRHFDGATWAEVAGPADGTGVRAIAAWGDDVWVSVPALRHRVGDGWEQLPSPLSEYVGNADPLVAWGEGAVFGGGGGFVYDVRLGSTTLIGAGPRYIYGVDGAGPDDVWAVGQRGLVAHFDGQVWRFEDQQPGDILYSGTLSWTGDLRDVWRAPNGAVWAVGEGGVVWRRGTDGVWTRHDAPTNARLTGVWGWADDRLWVTGAVGDEEWGENASGVLLAWDGAAWSEPATGPLGALRAVDGTVGVDVWAVGRGDVLYRYDGAQWSTVALPLAMNLGDLSIIGPGHVVAGGAPDVFEGDYTGLIVEVAGGEVTVTKTTPNEQILAIWADAELGAAFDASGVLWLRAGGAWEAAARPDFMMPIVGAVRLWSDGERLWLYGADGEILWSPPLTTLGDLPRTLGGE